MRLTLIPASRGHSRLAPTNTMCRPIGVHFSRYAKPTDSTTPYQNDRGSPKRLWSAIWAKCWLVSDTVFWVDSSSARPRYKLAVPSVTISEGTPSLTVKDALDAPGDTQA